MSTLSSVINSIKNSVSSGKFKPMKLLPAVLLLCTELKRPGLSAMDITAEYIRLNGELGIPTGSNPDGTPNLINASAYALISSMVKGIKMNGSVSFALPPGSITFTGFGANAGGPVTIKGFNDGIVRGQGIPG